MLDCLSPLHYHLRPFIIILSFPFISQPSFIYRSPFIIVPSLFSLYLLPFVIVFFFLYHCIFFPLSLYLIAFLIASSFLYHCIFFPLSLYPLSFIPVSSSLYHRIFFPLSLYLLPLIILSPIQLFVLPRS